MSEKITAQKFKKECLQIIDKVKRTRKKIIITKKNIPIAQLTPVDEKKELALKKLKDSVHILGNIINPIDEIYNADN